MCETAAKSGKQIERCVISTAQTNKQRCGSGCGTSFFPEKNFATISQPILVERTIERDGLWEPLAPKIFGP